MTTVTEQDIAGLFGKLSEAMRVDNPIDTGKASVLIAECVVLDLHRIADALEGLKDLQAQMMKSMETIGKDKL